MLPRGVRVQHCLPFGPASLFPTADVSWASFLLKPSPWPDLSWPAVSLPANKGIHGVAALWKLSLRRTTLATVSPNFSEKSQGNYSCTNPFNWQVFMKLPCPHPCTCNYLWEPELKVLDARVEPLLATRLFELLSFVNCFLKQVVPVFLQVFQLTLIQRNLGITVVFRILSPVTTWKYTVGG